MAAMIQPKYMTEGEAGVSLALFAGLLLCLVGAAGAQDAAFGFHAYLGAAASATALLLLLNRYLKRDSIPVPQEIAGKPNYNLGPVKFGAIASMVWGIAGFLV